MGDDEPEELPMSQSGGAADIVGEQTEVPDERTVNYVFPVEVIVVGALTDDDRREIYQQVWTDFGEAMEYQSA